MIFPQRSSDDDAETITIIGKKEKAEAAKDHLQKLIKELVGVATLSHEYRRGSCDDMLLFINDCLFEDVTVT